MANYLLTASRWKRFHPWVLLLGNHAMTNMDDIYSSLLMMFAQISAVRHPGLGPVEEATLASDAISCVPRLLFHWLWATCLFSNQGPAVSKVGSKNLGTTSQLKTDMTCSEEFFTGQSGTENPLSNPRPIRVRVQVLMTSLGFGSDYNPLPRMSVGVENYSGNEKTRDDLRVKFSIEIARCAEI